jgi:MFS family permease
VLAAGIEEVRSSSSLQALAFTYEACLLSFVLPAAILLIINAAIGPSDRIGWIATAWSLAAAIVTTIAGRCSDIFGRRNFFITGNMLGLIGMQTVMEICHDHLVD